MRDCWETNSIIVGDNIGALQNMDVSTRRSHISTVGLIRLLNLLVV